FDHVTVKKPDIVLPDRGIYFSKKEYTPEPVPTYSANKSKLPKPVLDGNPGWINMYDKAWELGFAHIKTPVASSPFVSNYYDEAFDGNIYQWDIIFMTMFGKYAHHIFPGIQSLDNFYCRQKISGSISRTINETTGEDAFDENSSNLINPPLFSWAEVESFKITGDKSRFTAVLPVLEKYYEFVHSKRYSGDTKHKLYWSNGQSSGMDNTPRDEGRPFEHYASDHQGWVDASAQMVTQCDNIATICEELGYAEKAIVYRAKAQVIADSINSWLWNEADGMYYDVKVDGTKMTWKSIAAFWPLLAGVTSAHQDSALIGHLKNPNEFWRDMVFPTLAASHSNYQSNGGYWLGAVWAPTNYAVIRGLERVGANEFAHEASERYVEGLYQVYLQTGTLWENYAADKINGKFRQGVNEYNPPSDCRKDFVGWTGLGPISILIENVLGFRADGVNKILTYDLRRTDRHGIENLRMADITTTIITDDRSAHPEEARLTVTSDNPYTLKVLFNGEIFEQKIVAGTQTINLVPTDIQWPATCRRGISVSPNPVADELKISIESTDSHPLEIKILDLSGKEILSANALPQHGNSTKTIPVAHLNQGFYFLLFRTLRGNFTEKFFKN
ncbi:MAG: T9SS type A sorting domain-containing protein, partial [Dysgonamonadaceae bacterium]|nr:T9SS type A sorting domain-containing protein [Dysgonamonadaceae bacterium]